jgi:uncharacterized protein (DUF58 family)
MLPAEVIRKIRRIEIRTNRLVTEHLAGQYHSVFKGRGMEFAESREYQIGDDVRSIDWNVTSRAGKLHVKVFQEERELTVVLLVDVSRSGEFGSGERLKREVAAEISALLAFSAIKNNDRVGLVRFTDRIEQYIPPRKGRTHVLRVVRELLVPDVEGAGTDLGSALAYIARVLTRPSVVFLISDFLDAEYERALRIAARKHDLVAIEIVDPVEERIPSVGLVELEDAETGRRRLLDTSSRRVREALAGETRRRREETRALLKRVGVDRVAIDVSLPYDRPLVRFFRERAARMRT